MTNEEIRQKAIEFVENMEDECDSSCPRLKDCKKLATFPYNPVKIFAYEDGFKDGIEEGKKQERERLIKILNKHWLSGTVAHRIIDEIILSVKGEQTNEKR